MNHRQIHLPLLTLFIACGAQDPVAHTVRVEGNCGDCGVISAVSEGTVFELEDGRLSLFVDFSAADQRTAMLEVVGIGTNAPEVRYHELARGRVAFVGVVDAAFVSVSRPTEEARVDGTITLDVHDAASGLTRSYTNIRVFPADLGEVGGGGGGNTGAGGTTGRRDGGVPVNTQVVVVVQPTRTTYVDHGGCDGSSGSGGGCEGDTYDDGGGCEGDTSGDASGCDGDTGGASGCEGDTGGASGCDGDTGGASGCDGDTGGASGCEGDIAARSVFPPIFRLFWPMLTVGAWNRRRRHRA